MGEGKNPYARADRFTKEAKAAGFAARSVFKLDAIQKRFRLLRPGQRVVDLGCSPGSWAQFAMVMVGKSGRVVGVDVEPPEVGGFTFLHASALDVDLDTLQQSLGGPADVVLSDMAPRTTGDVDGDHLRQIELAERALEVAVGLQSPWLVCKVFDGIDAPPFVERVRRALGAVDRVRPDAVRKNSREFFVVGHPKRP